MSDPYLGEIRMVGFNFAPVGWALCNGQAMSISQNSALFALLGTIYGGDGQTTFNLPDLQGRFPLHAGAGAGLPVYTQGQKAGTSNVILTNSQLPSHTHVATFTPSGGSTPTVNVTVQGASGTGTTATAAGNYIAGVTSNIGTTGVKTSDLYVPPANAGTLGNIAGVSATITGGGSGGTVTNALTGTGLPFSVQNPYLAVSFIIALSGVFPSRG
ncbi:MAG TPA: tail fiber protein [Acidobacteriaceae bacterium]|nr:tail fiber protein [Acidobacteriaceae bacterium]